MDKSIRDGIFSSIMDLERGDSCFLVFEDDQPLLHLDINITLCIELIRSGKVRGFTRNGQPFVADLSDTFSTNGRVTAALDDLVVGPWESPDHRIVEDKKVRTVIVQFDPGSIDNLFFHNLQPLKWAIDGDALATSNLDLIDHYSPAEISEPHGGLSLAITTKSALYKDAARSIARSPQERLILLLQYENPVELTTARRHISALQTLLEAIGAPPPGYLRELSLQLTDHVDGSFTAADWWSSGLLKNRGSHVEIGPASPRIPRNRGNELSPTGLDELGGLIGILRWIALCDDVPHLLSVLDSQYRGLTVDARASILSLAVGWEHLAARSRGGSGDTAWKEIADLISTGGAADRNTEKMLKLCWHTYLKVKHVELSRGAQDSRVTIANDDYESLGLAADFMHHTVLAAAFAIAGIPRPGTLDRRVHVTEHAEMEARWTQVVDSYLNA